MFIKTSKEYEIYGCVKFKVRISKTNNIFDKIKHKNSLKLCVKVLQQFTKISNV